MNKKTNKLLAVGLTILAIGQLSVGITTQSVIFFILAGILLLCALFNLFL